MSYIINKPATGKNALPTGVTFDSALVDYGDDFEQLNAEIKSDLLRELVTVTQTTSFNRGMGIGVDLYENESMSEITKIKLRLDIISAVERYNGRAADNKKIIASQESIDIEEGDRGELVINIFYMVESTMTQGAGLSNIQNVSLPTGG